MKKKSIEEMIDEVDKSINGHLSITHYPNAKGWEIHSYGIDDQISTPRSWIYAKIFREALEEAMKKLGLSLEKKESFTSIQNKLERE